jgi:hypothetical protein
MAVGENPRKVENIVSKNESGFRKLYATVFEARNIHLVAQHNLMSAKALSSYVAPTSGGLLKQDTSYDSRKRLWNALPDALQRLLLMEARKPTHSKCTTLLILSAGSAHHIRPPRKRSLRAAVSTVVARSSLPQALKGVLSAGSTPYLITRDNASDHIRRAGQSHSLHSTKNAQTMGAITRSVISANSRNSEHDNRSA